MFPWLWFWAPQLHLPWSGNVEQRIDPKTDWLFGAIAPHAGNGNIEQRVFEDVAAYGKQLGVITEVLMDVAENNQPLSARAQAALAELRKIRHQIEQIKHEESSAFEQSVEQWLAKKKQSNPDDYQRITEKLASSFGDGQ